MMRRPITVLSATILGITLAAPAAGASPDLSPPRPEGWVTSRSANRAQVVPQRHTVRSGDTLDEIARKHDVPGGFERLHYVNRDKIDHADLIEVGTELVIPTTNGKKIPYVPPPPPEPTWTSQNPSSSQSDSGSSSDYYSASTTTSGHGTCGGDLPSCEIMECESGGDIRAENPSSTASGKWQILDSTWNGYGGYARASDAPESVQDAKAAELWDGGAGRSQWVC